MKDQLYEISGKFLIGRKEKEHFYAPEKADGHLKRYKKLMDSGEYIQVAFEKRERTAHCPKWIRTLSSAWHQTLLRISRMTCGTSRRSWRMCTM